MNGAQYFVSGTGSTLSISSTSYQMYSWTYGDPGVLNYGSVRAPFGIVSAELSLEYAGPSTYAGIGFGYNSTTKKGIFFTNSQGLTLQLGSAWKDQILNQSNEAVPLPALLQLQTLPNGLVQGFVNGSLKLTYKLAEPLPLGVGALVIANGRWSLRNIKSRYLLCSSDSDCVFQNCFSSCIQGYCNSSSGNSFYNLT